MPPPAPLSAAADAVLTFLESVGRRSEAEFYLRQFLQLPKESFAVIAPGAPVMRSALGSLVEQLKFLADLGLSAPVVLGLFDAVSVQGSAERLAKRLPTAGMDPSLHDAGEPDLAGRLRDELRSDKVPIVTFPPDPSVTTADRLRELAKLVSALDTRKVVLIRRRGGLKPRGVKPVELAPGYVLPTDNGRISIINLRTDGNVISQNRLPKRDAELLSAAAQLIDLVQPGPPLVSVTSPLNLLKELFTVKGAGTLVKMGTRVESFGAYADVDVPRLTQLLESSFARPLSPSFFDEPPLAIYLAEDYRGAAVVYSSTPAPYLSKFAVEPTAQGEGMGRDLWQALARDYPKLFWRARPNNPIAAWYASVCDGMARVADWVVYWRGIAPEQIPEAISQTQARPPDFGMANS